jgi:hypothetical protein
MPLSMVNSVTLRPAFMRQFEECVTQLAAKSLDKDEPWTWTAHQPLFGNVLTLHFAYNAPDFTALAKLGTVEDLWKRVLGPKRGPELFDRCNECVEAMEHTISIDRPDLSYPPEEIDPAGYPFAVVTAVRVRPGQSDACEELIRKIAEAIPKIDDPARLITFQSIIGDLHSYWTVRPLRSIEDLDTHRPAPELLNQAFGPAEGGLLWRSGNDATLEVRREIMALRPDLSNAVTY